MKKIIIWGVLFFVILGSIQFLSALVYTNHPEYLYVIKGGLPTTKVKSSHGFTFTPPRGWVLWEGQSVLADAFSQNASLIDNLSHIDETLGWKGVSVDIKKDIEESFSNWRVENALSFIYTDDFVNVTSRDPEKQIMHFGRRANEDLNDDLEYHTIEVSVHANGIISNLPQGSEKENRFEVLNISINEKDSEYRRLYVPESIYDFIFIRVPFVDKNTPGYVQFYCLIPEEDTDEESIDWFKDFLKELTFDEI